MVGIIQEQHPDRCRLFAQWHGFDWPILNDPINLIPTRAVPVVVAIDEHGVVQSTRPRPDWVRNEFIKTDYPEPASKPGPATDDVRFVPRPTPAQLAKPRPSLKTAMATVVWGGALYRQTVPGSDVRRDAAKYFDTAISLYDGVLAKEPENAVAHFGRGVALRMRSESSRRQSSDFQEAVNAWGRALDLDPNHYIYRRRIQQYGPRLTKPYPFYDWVTKARSEIAGRGEKPVKLEVEPGGAEIAKPSRSFDITADAVNPDPNGQVNRDTKQLIQISTVTVPARTKPGGTVRLHLSFRPASGVHWNNEAEPVQVWVDPPPGGTLQKTLSTLPLARTAESSEVRRTEIEVKIGVNSAPLHLQGYALYYACEEETGTCMFLRQDFRIQVATR